MWHKSVKEKQGVYFQWSGTFMCIVQLLLLVWYDSVKWIGVKVLFSELALLKRTSFTYFNQLAEPARVGGDWLTGLTRLLPPPRAGTRPPPFRPPSGNWPGPASKTLRWWPSALGWGQSRRSPSSDTPVPGQPTSNQRNQLCWAQRKNVKSSSLPLNTAHPTFHSIHCCDSQLAATWSDSCR